MAPPLIALVITAADWRTVFYITGVLGIAWSAWWWSAYYSPDRHPRLAAPERELLAGVIAAGRTAEAPPRWRTLLQCARRGAW